MPTTRCILANTWSTLLVSAAIAAQEPLLSEVVADGDARWIEIHNPGQGPVDLSTWSLYHASQTPGMPQNYWWAFPAGTVLAPGGFLRVHWFRDRPATPGPLDLYTGTSIYGFLFGLGGEPLRQERGALALLRSQDNALMASATIVADWVSWGAAGFRRENLAVQAGRWANGRFVAPIAAGESIARNTVLLGLGLHDQEWFHDPSPTPLAPNVPGLSVASYGHACTALGHHLLGEPRLQTLSVPVVGNRQFGLRVTATTGLVGETVLIGFTWAAAPAGGIHDLLPPIPGGTPCPVWIDPRFPLGAVWLRARAMQTDTLIPLPGLELVGLRFLAQAMVLDHFTNAFPPYQGTTNGLDVTIGG